LNEAPGSPDPAEQDSGEEKLQWNLKAMGDEIENSMDELIDNDLVKLRRSDKWLEIEINSSILFPSASSGFAFSAEPLLKEIAKILSRFPNPVNVEGFTDNVPIATEQYPSNWELSAARAASVVHLFSRAGIDPRRMTAIGYGEHRPVEENDTPEGRAANRRVVLAVLAEDVDVKFTRELDALDSRPESGTGFPPVDMQ
jgi:chemotaxis protein MotB